MSCFSDNSADELRDLLAKKSISANVFLNWFGDQKIRYLNELNKEKDEIETELLEINNGISKETDHYLCKLETRLNEVLTSIRILTNDLATPLP